MTILPAPLKLNVQSSERFHANQEMHDPSWIGVVGAVVEFWDATCGVFKMFIPRTAEKTNSSKYKISLKRSFLLFTDFSFSARVNDPNGFAEIAIVALIFQVKRGAFVIAQNPRKLRKKKSA